MGYALLMVVVFMTGQGQNFATKHATLEECEASRLEVATKIGQHNQKASPPEYIALYATACVEIKEAPKGRDA